MKKYPVPCTPARSRPTVVAMIGSFSAMLALASMPASAATLVWDPSGAHTATGSAGSGNWDTTTSSWWQSGGNDTVWTDSNNATFGGTDGTAESYVISLTGGAAFATAGITINNTGYIFQAASAATLGLGSSGNLTIALGKSATIGSNVTLTGSNPSTGNAINGGGTLNIGGSGINNAAVTQTSGLLNINGGTTVSVNSGGILSTATALSIVIAGAGNETGTLTVNGGAVSIGGAGKFVLANGKDATGILNVNSGTVALGSSTVRFGTSSGTTSGTGTINLNGGTLAALRLSQTGSTTATINFNGGTLQATTNNTTFMTGTITNVVQTGGAKIDTNGFNITISQALTHDTNLGSTKDGGLVKTGTGTLTLSTANTFTGATRVSVGTLALADVNALQNSALDVSGDGTVTFTVGGANTYTLGGLQGVGTLTATGQTIALNASGSSAITITGAGDFQSDAAITVAATAFTFDGTLNITLSDTLSVGNHTFNLFDGQTGGAFDSVSIGGSYTATGAGDSAFTDSFGNSFAFDDATGDLNVTIVSAIPEPSACALLAGALVLGLAASRCHRKSNRRLNAAG